MAEPRYFPFDAVMVEGIADRAYTSDDFANYFAKFIGNGVYNGIGNSLQVFSLNSNMVLTIKDGSCMINGRGYIADEDSTLTIGSANASYGRYDLIVARLSYTNRLISIVVKAGTASSSPVAPTLQRDSDIWELQLAKVYVGAGVTQITQANITDTRMDSAVCGWVSGVIDQVDTSNLYAQYEAYWNMVKTQIDSDMSQFASGYNLYGVASGTGTYTATVSGFTLVEGINVKVKFTNGYIGASTLNINGLGAKPIKRYDNTNPTIKAGMIVNLIYDGTNFTPAGDGLSGTATPAQVLSGVTFTNDDGFQTGAMANNGDASTSIVNGVLLQGLTDGGAIANLVASNVKSGVNIGGIVGNVPTFSYQTMELFFGHNTSTMYFYLNFTPDIVIVWRKKITTAMLSQYGAYINYGILTNTHICSTAYGSTYVTYPDITVSGSTVTTTYGMGPSEGQGNYIACCMAFKLT